MSVDLSAIEQAREAIVGQVRQTPCWPSARLAEVAGVPVYLKCEQMQRTGSFKIRGAANFVAGLSEAQRARGLVTASAGNHAQGVALAAAAAGIDTVVVIPKGAPLAKASATRSYGATVVRHGEGLSAAHDHALAIASEHGRTFVPPFDDDRVIAGQGTVGLEILEQVPGVGEILVPSGGGGLLAGIGAAVKGLRPGVRVAGVQTAAMPGIIQSLTSGRPSPVAHTQTLADGVAVAAPSERTLGLVQRYADDLFAVDEEAIAEAMVMLLERSKMTVEGAGALGVAALQSGVYRPSAPVVVVLSGGNIDINLLGSVVHHGLVQSGRYQHLAVEVPDLPGQLAAVAQVVGDAGGNILEVHHDREARGSPMGVATLRLLLEVDHPRQLAEIVDGLRASDINVVPASRM